MGVHRRAERQSKGVSMGCRVANPSQALATTSACEEFYCCSQQVLGPGGQWDPGQPGDTQQRGPMASVCAAGTASVCLSVCPSVCLSIHGSGFQQDSTGTQGGGCSPRWLQVLVFRWPGRVGGVCCPEWLSSHQPRSAAGGWGASAAGACCGRQ